MITASEVEGMSRGGRAERRDDGARGGRVTRRAGKGVTRGEGHIRGLA